MNILLTSNVLVLAMVATLGIGGTATAGPHGPQVWGKQASEQSFIHRTVVVDQDTRAVQVRAGDTIRFLIGEPGQEQVFVWKFSNRELRRSVDMSVIAPENSIAEGRTWVHVRPDRLFTSRR